MRTSIFLSVFIFIAVSLCVPFGAFAAEPRTGTTFYVSKLGSNTDGLTWATAFNEIQTALDAIPDTQGGHRIIVRPDTYMEANNLPAFPGAEGNYNELVGDFDGSLGSGTSGHVILDAGDARRGFKSYDWWGNIRAYQKGWSPEHTAETVSAINWDRWILRRLYATGGDGGLCFDCTDRIEPFTVIVEDCVSIGRAFGCGAMSCLSRPDEPITFRRCNMWSLDEWGDTAAGYVRIENESMPDRPDIVFEDCTMVSPQCALKGGNYGFHTYTHALVKNCTLIALNFSQPHGTPTDGIVQSVQNGKYFHVDFENCLLMGFKVFGVKVDKETAGDIGYTTKGSALAYVQYTQEVPKGFHTVGRWPAEAFSMIAPPAPVKPEPILKNRELILEDMCEVTPFIWNGRLCHMECHRPGHGGTREDYYLLIRDAETGEELARFATGYGLANCIVEVGVFYAFASRFENDNWNDVTLFKSSDLKNWEQKVVIEQENEHLFNSSVCKGPDGFVMAYESNDPTYPAFTTKFAQSPDLENWTKLPDATFGTNRYTACPCIRYVNGYYYVLYLENRKPAHVYETYITRSSDLKTWELSSANPVLAPTGLNEGINASDPDIIEVDGKTYVYYAVGDQLTWMNFKRAEFAGTMEAFYEHWYKQPGIRDWGDMTAHREREQQANVDAQRARRTAWFTDARFGMFVHWGSYAVPARNNKGALASFVMRDEGIPVAEYEQYADAFNPTDFDANEWMAIAKSAGMRYLIFTSKHHEGFAMFDSALADYDAADRGPGRDIVRELVEAARAADIKIGFYYSMLDWHHPDYTSNLSKYVDEYLFGQVRELCTNYGPIDCIWFDGEWDHPTDVWRSEELIAMIRELQPDALINDRVGKGERGKSLLVDFYTREQPSEIDRAMDFERRRTIPWEACMTIGNSWGYKEGDAPLKDSAELIRYLVDVASRGGNLLLNVGPKADGTIPDAFVSRLRDMGAWLEKNGESIYGTQGSPFPSLPAGKCTSKENRIYLHFESLPDTPVQLPGLQNQIQSATNLATDESVPFNNDNKTVTLPDNLPKAPVTTIAITLDGEPKVGRE
ncbi:MAG: hypothetical protein AMXMBFR82_50350 [Candidatus Hydrogenedentota bacterium]